MAHEFPFGAFRPQEQDFLFRRSVAPENFPLEQPMESWSIYFPSQFSGNVFVNGKQLRSTPASFPLV